MSVGKMNGAQILVEATRRQGVDTIFFYTGGAILPGGDALGLERRIRYYTFFHEGIGALAAGGYARATGKVGTEWATSGPGGLNCVTGVADAMLDSVPLVIVTGQVPTTMIGNNAFQEADMVGSFRSNTKYNILVKDIKDLARYVKEAYYIAGTGRPGPVHIDIPKDIQNAETIPDFNEEIDLRGYKVKVEPNKTQVNTAIAEINKSNKPVLYVGGGVITSEAKDYLRKLAYLGNIPVTTTVMAREVFPENDRLNLGMLGMHGTAYANYAVDECDLLIAVGARFDDRVTGDVSKFAKNVKKIHIDIDPSEISKNVKVDVPIVGDARITLEQLCNGAKSQERREWVERISYLKKQYPLKYESGNDIKPQSVINAIYDMISEDAIITVGVGQHQMWAAQYFRGSGYRSFLSSSGLGTMGFAIPAAIGAQLGRPQAQVIAIDGDGSFQQYPQALMMLAKNKLPVKVILLNNEYHGMVKQWQEIGFEGRLSGTRISYEVGDGVFPDNMRIAAGYGVPGLRVSSKSRNIKDIVNKTLKTEGPFLLEVMVDKDEMVLPMVPTGGSTENMILDQPPIKSH